MASILDKIRGHKTNNLQRVTGIPDDGYTPYLAEVQRLPLKQQKKWKRCIEQTDGSVHTIRYDGEEFYVRWLNQRVCVK